MRLGSRGASEFSAVRLTFPARARVSPPALMGLGREQVWKSSFTGVLIGVEFSRQGKTQESSKFKPQYNLYSYLLRRLAKTNKGQCCQWRKTTFLWKSYCGKWSWIIRFLQTEEERVGLEVILYLSCAISLDAFRLVFLLTVHCCLFRICIWKSSRVTVQMG